MDNMRALLVGGTSADAERLATRLAHGASVICFAPDRTTGDMLKRTIAAVAAGARVSVMIGDPWLLVHKVSGPFDVIAVPADAHGGPARVRERLRAILREDGELDG
jgi:hypothetical protein